MPEQGRDGNQRRTTKREGDRYPLFQNIFADVIGVSEHGKLIRSIF